MIIGLCIGIRCTSGRGKGGVQGRGSTALFFSIAFVATGLPWMTWALGDLAVKLVFAICMLIPYGLLRRHVGAYQPG